MLQRRLLFHFLLFSIAIVSKASTSQSSPLIINDDRLKTSRSNPRSNWFRQVPNDDKGSETEDDSESKLFPKSMFRWNKKSGNESDVTSDLKPAIEKDRKANKFWNPTTKPDEKRHGIQKEDNEFQSKDSTKGPNQDEESKEKNGTKSINNNNVTLSQREKDKIDRKDRKDPTESQSKENESSKKSKDPISPDSHTLENDSRYLRRPWFGLRSDKDLNESIGDRVPSHQNRSTFDQSTSGPRRLQLEPKAPEDDKKLEKSQEINNSNATVITENEKNGISSENEESTNRDTNSTDNKAFPTEKNNESNDLPLQQDSKNMEKQNPPPPPISFSRQALPMGIPMQSQIPGNGVIIMGMDGRPQRGLPPGRQVAPPQSGAIISEAIATILSTAIRLWFLTSLTKWFADEERKGLRKPVQHFMWERLNDKYLLDRDALKAALATPPFNVPERKWRKRIQRQEKQEQKLTQLKDQGVPKPISKENDVTFQRTVIVVELSKAEKGDMDIAQMDEIVSFIISEHRNKAFGVFNATAVDIEVILLVESPGGEVSEFGLGAAQVRRLTEEEGIQTTVCVDKIAASGGYMIASQASKIVAAPFAVVGSIGVIRQGLNFHKALQKYGILPMVLTAGDAKAPISTYGEVTKSGLDIAQQNLNKIHDAFRELVVRGRPFLAETLDVIANGDIFLGSEAIDLQLVDVVMTSDQYILECVQAGDRVLRLHRLPPPARHRRIPSFHPLDFLRENGPRWLAEYDVPKIVSKLLQASPLLHLALQLLQNRFI